MISRPLSQIPDLVSLAAPGDPLVWVRQRRGFVGLGVAHRLETRGEARFAEASRVWAELQRTAEVDDPIAGPATGLIALGTFAFASNSAEASVLIVPRVVVGKKDGEGWITLIAPSPTPSEPSSSAAETIAAASVVDAATLPALLDSLGVEYGRGSAAQAAQEWQALDWQPPEGETEAYRDGVAEAGRRLEATTEGIEKIVLARRLSAELQEGADLRVPLNRLANRYLDCWTFAVDGMVGASPETLIRSIHGKVSARVLAGTRRRDPLESRDEALATELLESDKEQLEHRFAIDSLVETLTPHVTGLAHDDEPSLLQLPNVWHLATRVTAQLADGADAFELAEAVHPTAAVAGTPTPLAMRMIDELEPFDRGRYAGAVGWVGAGGNGDWAIALRSAQVDHSRTPATITAFAGGGLVVGADPEHELGETVSKFRPMVEACS